MDVVDVADVVVNVSVDDVVDVDDDDDDVVVVIDVEPDASALKIVVAVAVDVIDLGLNGEEVLFVAFSGGATWPISESVAFNAAISTVFFLMLSDNFAMVSFGRIFWLSPWVAIGTEVVVDP